MSVIAHDYIRATMKALPKATPLSARKALLNHYLCAFPYINIECDDEDKRYIDDAALNLLHDLDLAIEAH